MSSSGKRKSVSMRDYEYAALYLYTEDYKNKTHDNATMTSILRDILFGNHPPIPKEYMEKGKYKAEIDSKKKEQERDVKKNKPPKDIIGGGIFTF